MTADSDVPIGTAHTTTPDVDAAWRAARPMTFPVDGLSRILQWMLSASVVLNLLAVPALLSELAMLRKDVRGEAGGEEVVAARDQAALASLATLLLYVATAVVVIVWLYRARRNVEVYGARHQRYAPGWAIGGWFVPLVNCYVPFRVTADVLRDSEQRETRSAMPLLLAWWTVFLASNVADLASVRLDEIDGGIATNVLGRVTEALAALLLLLVLRRITAAQQQRESELT